MPPLTQGEDIKALVKKPPSEWPTRSKVQCKHENLIQTDVSYMDKSLVQEPVTVELNRKKVLPETVVVAFESCQLSSFCFDWCWAAVVEWLSSVVDVIQNDCCQLLSEWLLSVVVSCCPFVARRCCAGSGCSFWRTRWVAIFQEKWWQQF